MKVQCREGDEQNSAYVRVKVAIIGAGLSGLQCARTLIHSENTSCKLSKEDILILEARDRIGGRVHTTSFQLSKASTLHNDKRLCWFTYDEGAEFVHGTLPSGNSHAYPNTVNPVVAILESYKQRAESYPLFREVFSNNSRNPWTKPDVANIALFADWDCGRPIPESLMESALKMWETRLTNISKVGAAAYEFHEGLSLHKISVQETLGVLQWYRNLNKTSIVETLRMERIVEWYFHISLEVWNSLSLSQLPLSSYAGEDVSANQDIQQEEEDTCDGDFPGPHCTVNGGMGQLVRASVAENSLEQCVLCSQEVETIEWCSQDQELCDIESASINNIRRIAKCGDKGNIRIRSKTGLMVEADACVVTIPLGCLKDSAWRMFSPSLSGEKLEVSQRERSTHRGTRHNIFSSPCLTSCFVTVAANRPLIHRMRDLIKMSY